MITYQKRCMDGRHRATPRAIVVAGGTAWIQWTTSGEGQPPSLVTSSHALGSEDIQHVCWCLLGEHRPSGTVSPEDLMGHVAVIEVASYRVTEISPDPRHGTADLSGDPLHRVFKPVEQWEDRLPWCDLDLPPGARTRITKAVQATTRKDIG